MTSGEDRVQRYAADKCFNRFKKIALTEIGSLKNDFQKRAIKALQPYTTHSSIEDAPKFLELLLECIKQWGRPELFGETSPGHKSQFFSLWNDCRSAGVVFPPAKWYDWPKPHVAPKPKESPQKVNVSKIHDALLEIKLKRADIKNLIEISVTDPGKVPWIADLETAIKLMKEDGNYKIFESVTYAQYDDLKQKVSRENAFCDNFKRLIRKLNSKAIIYVDFRNEFKSKYEAIFSEEKVELEEDNPSDSDSKSNNHSK